MQSREALLEAVHSSRLAGGAPPVVLIVEDHADTLEMYDALLRSAGFLVGHASEALEAFEYAQDLQPDAVITDLGLPGPMDGADLIREMRADAALHDVPVVAVTGRAPRQMPSLAGLHMSALLLKPVAPITLVSRLKSAIAHSAATRAHDAAVPQAGEGPADGSPEVKRGMAPADKRHRQCPGCGTTLEWLNAGRLHGVMYDYYRWCTYGCGLYCFNRVSGDFEHLTGGPQ
jgi:CheY-like chemotaxis protein